MIKIKYILFFILAGFSSITYSQQKSSSILPRPKLVVGVVVDQMRWDYLYRYYDRYSTGGFKRLLNEGYSCENTQISYIPTYTACGHSSLYTGSIPSIHGITGNDIIVQASGYKMNCVEDTSVRPVGTTSSEERKSPKNLLASTITDELKLATNFRSKVIGIAVKDRGGILPAGHAADAAYWLDDLTGNWVTTTYYRANLPLWVEEFNKQRLVDKYLTQTWQPLYPLESYKQSNPDDSRYERKFRKDKASVFPYDIAAIRTKDYNSIRSTPFANTITFDFAKAALEGEKMGKGAEADFLAISLSATDYLGHQFGPNAVEIEDLYLRLDKDIANFLTYLDNTVGKGQYTIFLSADHGAAHNPSFLTDHKVPGGTWTGTSNSSRTVIELNSMLSKKYGSDKIVGELFNYQVHFNYPLINEKQLDISQIKKDVIAYYKKQDPVLYAVDLKNVGNEPIPDALRSRIINGYNEKRSGEIQLILKPGYYLGAKDATGTSHGSWNPYDSHIPLVFMGWGIKQGKTNRLTYISDVASTLAGLLHIQEPNGNIGQPITEVFK